MSRHGTRPASPRFLAAHGSAPHPRSGGAVIIIVLTLLSTMVFLGFFFFGFTDQASLAARSYAEADDSAGVIDPEAPTDLALEQLIVGTRSQYEESALWGGRHSILSHIVGPIDGNLRPRMDSMYAGGGMRMVLADSDANGTDDCYAMDYTGDGIADDLDADNTPDHIAYTFNESDPPNARVFTPAGGLTLNFSRVAQPERRQDAFNSLSYGFTQGAAVSTALNPATGYTYPDLNSLFLSYEKSVNLLDAGTGNSRSVKMVVPSFFRPQLLLAERQGGSYSTQQMFEVTGAGVETLRPRMSLRPHERHRNLNGLPRFVTADTVAQSGDTSRLIRKFPFNVDRDKNLIENEYGLFTDATDSERDNATAAYPRSDFYEYDVDNDGDGRADSIWVDIGLPMIELTDGRQVVPLVAYKVTDADALFNVNAHGNLTGLYFNSDTTTQTGFIDTNASGTQDPGELSVPFHRSNMGLGPGEINFSYGMFDDVAVLSAADRERLAREFLEMNMISNAGSERHVVSAVEAMFLLTGRVPYGNQQALAGRHGETNVLLDYLNGGPSITPPRAGRTNTVASPTALQIAAADDDVDYQTSGGLGYRATNPNVNNIPTPPGVHPLPLNGGGISYLSASASGGTRLLATPMTNNPSSWPDYRSGHWNDHNAPNNTPTTVGVLPYSRAGGGVFNLQTAGQVSTLDEDDELVTNQTYTSSSDAPFAPSENAALQLSNTDFELSGESSRLKDLAPFNFGASPNVSGVSGHSGADANRKLFTTDSWDRNELGLFPALTARSWEFNTWVAGDTVTHFPPRFGTVANNFLLSSPYVPQGTQDPLRYELRRLFATALGGFDVNGPNYEETRIRPQMPLNINRVLTGFDIKGNPLYRELVPHPQFTLADGPITLPGTAPAFSSISMAPGNLAGRVAAEWWARNDRQNMARDIYVMLWFLSGGKDGTDYTNSSQLVADLPPSMPPVEDTATAGREDDHYDVANGNVQAQIEARDRLREMAQFAVNVVDALDRDNVITEFRYDENLTDGWDISTTFQSVYGVEAAQLTLSEVLAIRTPPVSSASSIEYEHARNHRYHLFVELKNASAFDVPISNEAWRIRRIRSGTVTGLPERFATLRDSAFTSNTGTAGAVGPGELYLIASHDGGNSYVPNGTDYRPSDFRVDHDGDGDFDAVVPNLNDPTVPTAANTALNYPAPLCDLDLFANGTLGSHVGRYWANTSSWDATPVSQFTNQTSLLNGRDVLEEAGATPMELTDYDNGSFDPADTRPILQYTTIVLERRLLNSGVELTDGSGNSANPWVEVDRMPSVEVQVFNINSSSMTSDLVPLLENVRSIERREPLHPQTRKYQPPTGITANSWQQHTLPQIAYGQADERNSSLPTGTNYRHWQPHFDRDFASVMDLLSIPLYGYAPATTNPLGVYDPRLDRTSAGTDDTTGEARMFRAGGPTKNVVDLNGRMSGHRTAAMRFLFPEATPGANVLNLTTRSTGYDGVTPSSAIEIQKHFRNRWYRFLHFITVPDRSNERANQLVAFNGRTPGKLNLNTIRHEQVMAGLLDDPVHMNPLTYPTTSLTTDRLEPSGANARHWFNELLGFRDQADPILGAAYPASSGVTIPGNVNSVPFRPLAHLDSTGDQSITQTILRNRISSSDTNMDNILDTQPHGLFEARASTDVGTDAIDYHTRNRLLAKIHNRSTTRSNVFFVWTTIGFFDAHQPPFAGNAGYVTIGAQAEDLPMRRTFSVVDMSRLEEAYDDPDPTDGTPGTFDFRKFVIYRKQIK